MDATGSERLVTPKQVAQRYGVPVKRIRAAIRSGDLPAYQLGTWRRVRLDDVHEWLERHRFRPEPS